MNHEYRIVEGYGSYMNKRWELQKQNNLVVGGWSVECHGTKEFCEEALQKRLDRIKVGLEPTLYEQRRKAMREKAIFGEYSNELPW